MQLRTATSVDAVAVADLHADSWRRHCRLLGFSHVIFDDDPAGGGEAMAVRYAWRDAAVLLNPGAARPA